MKHTDHLEPGTLFILSGPSGAGKDAVLSRLLDQVDGLVRIVSYTSRLPRAEEQDGREYHFVTPEEMHHLRQEGRLLECTEYIPGVLYGMPKDPIDAHLAQGLDVIIKPEVRGGLEIRAQYPQAVTIFLAPPSVEEAIRRIQSRATDSPEQIARRAEVIKLELELGQQYDYHVVNETGHLDETVEAIRAIIEAVRHQKQRSH